MAQAVMRVEGLPETPLDAAAMFHARYLDQARAALDEADALALVFPLAGHEHLAWRVAAVQELAREAAPRRVNAVAGDDEAALATTLDWLAESPGITGQILAVDGKPGETG
jgi:hypothetical protein